MSACRLFAEPSAQPAGDRTAVQSVHNVVWLLEGLIPGRRSGRIKSRPQALTTICAPDEEHARLMRIIVKQTLERLRWKMSWWKKSCQPSIRCWLSPASTKGRLESFTDNWGNR